MNFFNKKPNFTKAMIGQAKETVYLVNDIDVLRKKLKEKDEIIKRLKDIIKENLKVIRNLKDKVKNFELDKMYE